ncbi:MAG: zinc ribbon domain-containing protein [Oscillospiraceae bacterium]|nr:zinc ribbon domain-containing protein [Oscillospiraceae bacterium]
MICKECGAKLPPDQPVCPRCGFLQPQAVRPVQRRQKPANVQQASGQKIQKQTVYTWRDKLVLGGAVVLVLCAMIWFVSVLVGTMGSSNAKNATQSSTQQVTSSSVVTTVEDK